jgi:hypothetical protein
MVLVKKVKCILVPKNAGIMLGSSGYFQVRHLLTWSLVSLLLQVKSKLATGNSVPSAQTANKTSNEWKLPQRNDANVICLPAKYNTLRNIEAGHGYLWSG